ncbi:NAD(P)/FAD-dependent oxidoreductase [Amycolatopsis sp. WAC 04197]|uniref:flavin-containing monooxygenase n=1 Tax=Amycolatopsis sp. WAC 04197 TaxID=2203199 RepID=UPI0018F772D3|nr:NAD(P)/FAD-dependent oxidoreductase [Amycolatopsis sp. WAC 04197]
MINPPLSPVRAGDAELRRILSRADLPTLLMTVAHLTGDVDVLPEDYNPSRWLPDPAGGLSAAEQDKARELGFRLLRALRDGSLPPPVPPSPETLRRITTWAMGWDTVGQLPLLAEEIVPSGADPKAPDWTLAELAPGREFRVVVVGAGPSGLLAGHRLAQAGIPFVIHEKNDELGGTWLENSYPGCRVDVPSHLYSYTFATRSDWPEQFCTQDEFLSYLRAFAKENGLHEHIRFGSEVRSLEWDGKKGEWRIRTHTDNGEELSTANVVITAVGQLNRPKMPDIPGADRFDGPAFHSAAWDHTVDLSGRRVAVIGTGASAFQFVPEIAPECEELVVFQRTPPWLRATPHYRDQLPDEERWLQEHVPYYAAWYRFGLFAPGLQGAPWVVDPGYPPTERAVSAANDDVRAVLTAAMEAQLADAPDLREKVIPRYPIGAKRVLRDDGTWLQTLKRDDVTLVTDPIGEVTTRGIRTADGTEYDADVLIFATGFRASEFLTPMKVTGPGNRDLHEHWGDAPAAYLGMLVPGFPNLFSIYGPNTNLVGQGGSVLYFSECAMTYLLGAIRYLLASGRRSLSVRSDVCAEYQAWVDATQPLRAWGWSSVSSWFKNEHGRSVQNWPFSAFEYWNRTRRFDPDACTYS